jgi:hypothetical protein
VSAQIPEEEVPRYLRNNSHLKGHDKTLLEHVVSEVMAAYGDQLAQKRKTSRNVEQDGRTRHGHTSVSQMLWVEITALLVPHWLLSDFTLLRKERACLS